MRPLFWTTANLLNRPPHAAGVAGEEAKVLTHAISAGLDDSATESSPVPIFDPAPSRGSESPPLRRDSPSETFGSPAPAMNGTPVVIADEPSPTTAAGLSASYDLLADSGRTDTSHDTVVVDKGSESSSVAAPASLEENAEVTEVVLDATREDTIGSGTEGAGAIGSSGAVEEQDLPDEIAKDSAETAGTPFHLGSEGERPEAPRETAHVVPNLDPQPSLASSDQVDQLEAQLAAARSMTENLQKALLSEQTTSSSLKESLQGQGEELSAAQQLNASLTEKISRLDAQRDSSQRSGSDVSAKLEEQMELSANLLREGEALQKKLQMRETAIKKMKQQRGEHEKQLQRETSRADAAEKSLTATKDRVKELEEQLRSANDSVSTLQAAARTNRKQLESHADSAEKATVHATQLQEALDKAWAENKELREAQQDLTSTVVESDSKRKAFDDELLALQKHKDRSVEAESALQRQLAESRSALTRAREKGDWKEQQLQQEIEQLRERVAAEEARYESVKSAVPDSTRPLVRQIEAMRASAAERERVWEVTEVELRQEREDLKQRLAEVESSLLEHAAQTNAWQEKVKVLERECAQLRATGARQAADLKEARSKYSSAEDARASAAVRAEDAEAGLEALLVETRDLRENFANAVETSQAHERRVADLQAQVRQLQLSKQQMESRAQSSRSTGYGSAADHSDTDGSMSEGGSGVPRVQSSDALVSVIGSLPGGRLQELVRQKESELEAMQGQLQVARRRLDALQDDLVEQGSRNEQLEERVRGADEITKELADLRRRHDAALVLMGEREETIEELRMDLVDVKELYKGQISELLVQLAGTKA